VETLSSQQTIYLEKIVEEDVIARLQRQMGLFTKIKCKHKKNTAKKNSNKIKVLQFMV
jgi:hypothetical protein